MANPIIAIPVTDLKQMPDQPEPEPYRLVVLDDRVFGDILYEGQPITRQELAELRAKHHGLLVIEVAAL